MRRGFLRSECRPYFRNEMFVDNCAWSTVSRDILTARFRRSIHALPQANAAKRSDYRVSVWRNFTDETQVSDAAMKLVAGVFGPAVCISVMLMPCRRKKAAAAMFNRILMASFITASYRASRGEAMQRLCRAPSANIMPYWRKAASASR